MPADIKLSVVITTRNEAAHIEDCVSAFRGLVDRGDAEVLVVDNASDDDTAGLARRAGATVFEQGPERSVQRNRGAREAKASFVLFLDADMIVPTETQEEILQRLSDPELDAMYVREVRGGEGWWIKVRNFERSFYDATCIDCIRLVRRDAFLACGGFDESLCGVEDWDLDRRFKDVSRKTLLTTGFLIHNEKHLTFKRHLEKKRYYSASFAAYRKKWHNDAIIRKQFGAAYRFFGVFTENGKWRRVLRHPILFTAMMCERFCVGIVYLSASFSGGARN